MRNKQFRLLCLTVTLAIFYLLNGCGAASKGSNALFDDTDSAIAQAHGKIPESTPVVTSTPDSWLMGESVQVLPAVSSLLRKEIAWRPAGKVNLLDITSHISQRTGLLVDTTEVQYASSPTLGGAESLPNIPTMKVMPPLPTPAQFVRGGQQNQTTQLPYMTVAYEGPISGLLDYAASKSGVWWKFSDGKVNFFRSLTETVYIPAVARKSSGTSIISATTGASSYASSGSGISDASNNTGSFTSKDEYAVDIWEDLEKTAKVVAGISGTGEAKIAVNKSLSSITVTGSPAQVKNIRTWARSLTENLSQQVAITATMYTVDVVNEDYYQWDPTIIFQKLSSAHKLNFTGATAPTIHSDITPAAIGLGILNNDKTGVASNLDGTQLAFRALSHLGRVSGTIRQTIVTLNGQKAPMQIGRQIGYIPTVSTTMTPDVGAMTSITTGSITVGFTANFYPQIINGKILLSMDIMNSSLDQLRTRTSGEGNRKASVQTPETSSSSFTQSVSLTPGDALMLTGVQHDSGHNNKSGVGSTDNFLLGGGADAMSSKKLIAIVISAKVI